MRPSAFAVFRLITSSNLVGCSTLHREIAGLHPPEDFVRGDRATSSDLCEARRIGEKSTLNNTLSERVNRGSWFASAISEICFANSA